MKRILALIVALASTLLIASPASAAPTLDDAKTAVANRIDKRLDALKRFDEVLGKAKQLTAAHKDTLTKLVAGQRDGLTALKTKVQGETTAAALKADAQSMVN